MADKNMYDQLIKYAKYGVIALVGYGMGIVYPHNFITKAAQEYLHQEGIPIQLDQDDFDKN